MYLFFNNFKNQLITFLIKNYFLELFKQLFLYINYQKINQMIQQNKSSIKQSPTQKTILPFLVHRAPLENHIAYQKKGHWTEKEKLKYVIFLSYFKQKFTSRDKKKRFCRIFKVMSDFIKTRTHNQCRSHHQKMEKQRFEVDSIIKNVVSKYHPRVYKELYERYLVEIQNLNIEDLQQYKFRKINQNQLINISQINQEDNKKIEFKICTQKSKQKKTDKNINNYPINLNTKQQQCVQLVHQNCNKKQLKLTQQCDQDQFHYQFPPKDICYQFPPQQPVFSEKQKSYDYFANNGCLSLKFDEPNQVPMGFSDYLQSLQMRKLACLNKATFHYNQMQIELNNVAQYEREKQNVIEQHNQKMSEQRFLNYGISNWGWGFSNLCNMKKSC